MSSRTPDAESRYVDGRYQAEHSDWHEEDAPWKAAQVYAMIVDHGLTPRSICDIGCGTAGVLANLATHLQPDVQLVGLEPAEGAVGLAGDRRGRIDIRTIDARECRDRFDLALMLDVFEHIEDYLGFLRAVQALAGNFIFNIPLDMSVQTVLRMSPLLTVREVTGHLHYFSEETALATLADTGFEVVDRRLTRAGIELPRRSIATRAAALPRAAFSRFSPHMAARVLGGSSLLVLAQTH